LSKTHFSYGNVDVIVYRSIHVIVPFFIVALILS